LKVKWCNPVTQYIKIHRFAAQGRLQGLQDGETQGTQEGYSMGLQQGEQIGKEIGFYVAICEELSKIVQDHKSQYSPR
jgi:flagellar biosynthesis/type III secretory pathway protein FliH